MVLAKPKKRGAPEAKTMTSASNCPYCSKTASRGAVMSIHNAFSGKSGAMISWWRFPPEKTVPALMISITSGGKNGFGFVIEQDFFIDPVEDGPYGQHIFAVVHARKRLHRNRFAQQSHEVGKVQTCLFQLLVKNGFCLFAESKRYLFCSFSHFKMSSVFKKISLDIPKVL